MAKKQDLNTEVLIQIRDELRTTRTELTSRIDATNERLDATRTDLSSRIDATRTDLSSRIDATNERLDRVVRRQTDSEVRVATELVAVADTVRELRDTLLEDRR
jgi:hypothetical protein